MESIIGVNETICKPVGNVVVRAFEAGMVPALMEERELSLNQAISEAMRLGGLKNEIRTHNLVTTSGKEFIAKLLSGDETVGLSYFALGTGTAVAMVTDTQLASESKRKLITDITQGDVNVYSSVFFLASECSFHIREGGLFGGAAATITANSGILFARFLLDTDNTVNQDDLTFQHTGEVQ